MYVMRRLILGGSIGALLAVALSVLVNRSPNGPEGGVSTTDLGGTFQILLSGVVIGSVYALLFQHSRVNHSVRIARGTVLGMIVWVILSLNLLPVSMGVGPLWEASAVTSTLPQFIANLFLGAFSGLLYGLVHVVRNTSTVQKPGLSSR